MTRALALLLDRDGAVMAHVLLPEGASALVSFLDHLFAVTPERTLGGWLVYRRLP